MVRIYGAMQNIIYPIAVLSAATSLVRGAVIIDDFSIDQGPFVTATDEAITDSSILSGQRDSSLLPPTNVTSTFSVSGGVATVTNTGNPSANVSFGSMWITYDGIDADASRNAGTGFGGYDLLAGGANAAIELALADVITNAFDTRIGISLRTGGGFSSSQVNISAADSNSILSFSAADFLAGNPSADLTDIQSVQIFFAGGIVGASSMSVGVESLQIVPEPSSIMMLGGLGFACLLRRSR